MTFQKFVRLSRLVYTLCCTTLAVYMVSNQIKRFNGDADVSTITYRRFNVHSIDLYPTITFCFSRVQVLLAGCNNGIYSQTLLSEKFLLNNCKFEQILSGKSYDQEDFNMTQLRTIATDELYLHGDSILARYWTIDHKSNQLQLWKNENQSQSANDIRPVYVSHRTPQKICFSRNTTYDEGLIRANDVFTFNLTYLSSNGNLNLEVFVHYSQQAIRGLNSFGTKKMKIYVNRYLKFRTWLIYVSQFNVLRKRNKPNSPCSERLDEDDYLRETIMKRIGCIPFYWEKLNKNILELPQCHSYDEIKRFYAIISNQSRLLSSVVEPCHRMTTLVYLEKETDDGDTVWTSADSYEKLIVQMRYEDDMYMEVINTKEFRFKTFFGNVGGLVGIFLGVSLSHIPQFIYDVIVWLNKYPS